MQRDLLVLEVDKEIARTRIAELEAEIMALGPEFYEAFNQTSETWHDNAPFEIVRDRQNLLATEMHNLKTILRNSLPSIPKQPKGVVCIGSRVKILNTRTKKSITYYIAGDWTANAGQEIDGAIIISLKSPLAQKMAGRKAGEKITHNDLLVIESIE